MKMKNGKKVPNCVPIKRAKTLSTMEEQTQKIEEAALALVKEANTEFTGTRRVTDGAALEIVARSIFKNAEEPFSIRKHRALTELSHFITLAQHNRVMASVDHTDLLPIAHPRSTRLNNLTASALAKSRARWITDDPQIQDPAIKALLASALTAHPASAEYEYSIARLESFPEGQIPQYALTAAFDDYTDAERSANAKKQLRDRKGRFAFMGGGLKALVRRFDGAVKNLIGKVAGYNESTNSIDMELPDGRLVRVPAGSSDAVQAVIPSMQTPDGYSKESPAISAADPVIDEADLVEIESPGDFQTDANWAPNADDQNEYGDIDLGKQYTNDVHDVIKVENNQFAKDQFEMVEQRQREGQRVVAKGDGEDGALDPNKPVFIVKRRGSGDERPFAVVQSWADAVDMADKDARGEKVSPADKEPQAVIPDGEAKPRPKEDFIRPDADMPYGPFVPGRIVPDMGPPIPGIPPGMNPKWEILPPEQGRPRRPRRPRTDDEAPRTPRPEAEIPNTPEAEIPAEPAVPQRKGKREAPARFRDAFKKGFKEGLKGQKTAPEGFYDVNREGFEPEGALEGQASPDFTDDPVELAQRFTPEQLQDALKKAVSGSKESPASGFGQLPFEQGDEIVPADALFHAIKEQGGDADQILNDIYSPPKEKKDKAKATIPADEEADVPVAEAPTAEVPPLIEGLTPDEQRNFIDNGDYKSYLPENLEPDVVPEGYVALDNDPFDAEGAAIPEGAPEGFSTNPVDIALGYDKEDLKSALRRSIEPNNAMPGHGVLGQEDENGEIFEAFVPGEAIRDALQLQGEDTNKLIDDIYKEGAEQPSAQEIADAVEGENAKEEPAEPTESPAQDAQGPNADSPEAGLPADNEAGRVQGMEEAPEGGAGTAPGVVAEGSQEADLAMGEPRREMVRAADLQPGDIAVRDNEFFVIDEVPTPEPLSERGQKDKKRNRIAVKGHYPGHQVQERNWFANGEIEVIRGVAAPEKGDAPALDKPELADYGKLKKFEDGWGLADPAAQAKYDADLAAHKAAVQAAGANFVDPTKVDAEGPVAKAVQADEMPAANAPFIAKFKASELQVGDITVKDHFRITNITKGDDGKILVEGHYPGQGLQTKQWWPNTGIEVIRGIPEDQAPQLGEGSLHRPAGEGPKGGWFPIDDTALNAAHEARVAEAKGRWNPPADLPVVSAAQAKGENKLDENIKAPNPPREPAYPAFMGKFAEWAREAKGNWAEFKKKLAGQDIIVFDFETTGIGVEDGNEPWQIAAVKMRDGKIIDRINIFMNPGKSIKDTFAGNNAKDPDGNPLTDDFFADKPTQAEGLQQFLDWAGANPLAVAQNAKFDDEVMKRKAAELGLEWNPAGMADTMGMAAEIFKDAPDAPGRKNLGAIAEFLGIKNENWHDGANDAEVTAQAFMALIDKAAEGNFGVGALDADAQQAAYDAKMAELAPRIEEFKKAAADFLAKKALKDGLAGKEVNLEAIQKEIPTPLPEGPIDNVGAMDNPEQAPKPQADLVDVNIDSAFPDGKMRIADPEFAQDLENVDQLFKGEIRADDLRPGDFVKPKKDGDEFFQIVSVRGGEEFGIEEWKRRIVMQNANGEQKVAIWNWNAFLDEVRRPKDRKALAGEPLPEVVRTPEEINMQAVTVATGNGVLEINQEGNEFVAKGRLLDNEGNEIYAFEARFLTPEGAELEGKALLRRAAVEQADAARRNEGKPQSKAPSVSIGKEPANVDQLPVIEVVEDLEIGEGQNEITPQAEGDKIVFKSEAKVVDDGEVLAEVVENFPSRKAASEGGRNNIDAMADAIVDKIKELRDGLLLRTAGRGRRNLPSIPSKYRRQVFLRMLAGLYADAKGNPLAIGDKVIHENPKMAKKYGEGIVIGKVQGRIGGLQRKGVVYVDYVRVQYPDGSIRKFASRFQRHVDSDVAKQRFDAEPRINWMNQDEMDIALAERRKKPRKGGNEEVDAADDEVDAIVEDVKDVVAPQAVAPEAPAVEAPAAEEAPAPEVPVAPAVSEPKGDFKLLGDEFVRRNGVLVNGAKVSDVKVGDFVQTLRGNFGRVVAVDRVGDRIQITVEYPNGKQYQYKPYRANGPISGLYRVGDAEGAPAAPAAPELPAELIVDEPGDRNIPVPRISPAMTPAAEDPQIAIDEAAALKDLAALKRELGPQNAQVSYSKQRFVKHIQDALRAYKRGDLRMAKYYLDKAKNRLGAYDAAQNAEFKERLDKMDILVRNADQQESKGPEVPVNGMPLEEFDPLAVADKRIADNENVAPEMDDFWKNKLISDAALDQLAVENLDIRRYKDEIQAFFNGPPRPMAALNERARFALQAAVQRQIVKANKDAADKANIKNLLALNKALHDERLAFEPNDGSKLDARGALLLEFSPDEIGFAVRNGGRLVRNGQDMGFIVKNTNMGGGRQGTNKTFRVIDLQTGKVYYYKIDTDKENVDAELAALDLARALGLHGVYPAERHPTKDNVVIMGQAGQNLKLKKGADVYAKENVPAKALVVGGPIQQVFDMMVLDAVIHNNDRHGQNFLVAKHQNAGENLPDLGVMPLIIDNGLGQIIAKREDRHGRAASPMDFILGRSGNNRAREIHNRILDAMGPKAFYEMMQISTQQAIQALRRQYPAGANVDMDALVDRLEELRDADLSVWGG
jgi:DNA polymerase III epsilon subunit-like protein